MTKTVRFFRQDKHIWESYKQYGQHPSLTYRLILKNFVMRFRQKAYERRIWQNTYERVSKNS